MENNLSVDEKVSNFKNDASYLEFAYDEFKQFYELIKEENLLKDSLAFVSFLEDFVIDRGFTNSFLLSAFAFHQPFLSSGPSSV